MIEWSVGSPLLFHSYSKIKRKEKGDMNVIVSGGLLICTCTVLALLPNKSHSWVDNYRQLILRWHRHTGLIGLAKRSLIRGQFEYFIFNYLMLSLFTDYQSACSIFKQFPIDNIAVLDDDTLLYNKHIVFTFTVVIILTCAGVLVHSCMRGPNAQIQKIACNK